LDELPFGALGSVEWKGLPLGRLVGVPVRWYLCNTHLEDDPLAGITFRRFLRSAAGVADELTLTLDRVEPDLVVMLNGMFLFEQVARELCRRRGVDVVTYERGYMKGTLFFHRQETASRYDTSETWPLFRDHPLTGAEQAELDEYLEARRFGGRAITDFWPDPE